MAIDKELLNMPERKVDPHVSEAQQLESLRRRHSDLNEARIGASKELQMATQQLEDLKKDALAQFGTDDVQQLQEKLATIKAENARLLEEYAQHLTTLEAGLAAVERQYAAGAKEP